MRNNFRTPKRNVDQYGNVVATNKVINDFEYLVGMNINDIILFEDGTDELIEQGATILPRHYHLFEGVKDGEIKFKPYEYNPYRIVVSTYKDIIISIDSIG
jgi:hypothetical protein